MPHGARSGGETRAVSPHRNLGSDLLCARVHESAVVTLNVNKFRIN